MAKRNTKQDEKLIKRVNALDTASKSILRMIDTSYREKEILTGRDAELQMAIQDELDIAKGISQGSIVDFISAIRTTSGVDSGKDRKDVGRSLDNNELFTRDIGDIYGYFQDIYKNRYLEVSDLKFISKFIPAIGEAVKTTLDHITSSDDVSCPITRNLIYPTSLSSDEKAQVDAEVKRMETEYNLLKKLKNVVYKKALITGEFYIYAVSYKDLFEEYSRLKASGELTPESVLANRNIVNGNFNASKNQSGFNISKKAQKTVGTLLEGNQLVDTTKLSAVLESSGFDKKEIESVNKITSEYFGTYTISNDKSGVLNDAIYEMAAVIEGENTTLEEYKKTFGGNLDISAMPDGTMDVNDAKAEAGRSEKFNTSGTYIKYIDCKNIIPLRVYNQTIGYYHVHSTPRRKDGPNGRPNQSASLSGIGATIFSSASISQKKQEDAVNAIVNTISDGILANFSNSFVQKNPVFRNLISDCLIANGLINNDFNIQFIPANNIIPFVINENEEGMGESILTDSLFPAKLLLSLIISKMLNYMNNSGPTTIAHVHKGPIEIGTNNQVQRVIRNMTESNINFNDMISSNMVFSKLTRHSRIQLPTSKDGKHLVEFETQDGQNIDMNPEFENWLEKNAIMGTGVPSVIMDYMNSADFAKSYTTSNIKFAGRVSSLDSDLEEPTTRLYIKLIQDSTLPETLKARAARGFQFKLPRPKVLTNANNSEFMSTLLSNAQTIADIMLGQNDGETPDPLKPLYKDAFTKEYIVANSPFIDWEQLNALMANAKLSIKKDQKIPVDTDANSGTDDMSTPDDGGDMDDTGSDEF